jgi:hypothetical protein
MYGTQQTDKKPTISAVVSHDASAGRGQVRERPWLVVFRIAKRLECRKLLAMFS